MPIKKTPKSLRSPGSPESTFGGRGGGGAVRGSSRVGKGSTSQPGKSAKGTGRVVKKNVKVYEDYGRLAGKESQPTKARKTNFSKIEDGRPTFVVGNKSYRGKLDKDSRTPRAIRGSATSRVQKKTAAPKYKK